MHGCGAGCFQADRSRKQTVKTRLTVCGQRLLKSQKTSRHAYKRGSGGIQVECRVLVPCTLPLWEGDDLRSRAGQRARAHPASIERQYQSLMTHKWVSLAVAVSPHFIAPATRSSSSYSNSRHN